MLLRFYPAAWRARFGAEFAELLTTQRCTASTLCDVLRAAATERLFDPSGLGKTAMQTYPQTVILLLRKPSAYLPIVMSLMGMTLALCVVAVYGSAARQPDEGAAAHLFQLLIVVQAPILGFFALKWLSHDRLAALSIMVLQAAAIGIALLPVRLFGL